MHRALKLFLNDHYIYFLTPEDRELRISDLSLLDSPGNIKKHNWFYYICLLGV